MGWDIIHAPLGCSPAEYLKRQYTYARPEVAHTVEKIERLGSTYYLALRVRRPIVVEGFSTRMFATPCDFVTALVILTQGSGTNPGFGYKEMDESMGPVEANASADFLACLTPLLPRPAEDNPLAWAHDWRERCRANASARAAA